MKKQILLQILSILIFIAGCSVQKLAVRSMGGILDNSMAALYEESALILAEQAIASDLKLLEGLIKTDPGNEKLLLLACQGFGSYALGFVEEKDPERAKNFYLRGKGYGLKILNNNPNFQKSITGSTEELKQSLASFNQKDVPALFWTANNWANWINLNFNNPDALIDLPRVQALMKRVLELDESYFFGGAHLFFATILAIRPPILGGDIKKAKYHFDMCFKFSKKKFLLPHVFYAQYYLSRQFDEEQFVKTLKNVLATPDNILPGQQLPNAIAKKKASALLKNKSDFF